MVFRKSFTLLVATGTTPFFVVVPIISENHSSTQFSRLVLICISFRPTITMKIIKVLLFAHFICIFLKFICSKLQWTTALWYIQINAFAAFIFLGFPPECYDRLSLQPKFMSLSLHLTEGQFKERIMELFPRLVPERPFSFHKLNKNKKPEIVNVLCPRDIKELRYFGVLIIVSGGHARSISFAPHTTPIIGTISSASITRPLVTVPITTRHTNVIISTVSSTTVSTAQPSVEISTTPLHTSTVNTTSTTRSAPPLSRPTLNEFNASDSDDPVILEPADDEISLITNKRSAMYDEFSTTQQVLINRENIFSQAIEWYKNDDIITCKLYVKFENERGEDLDGVTREFFSAFWQEFNKRYSSGAGKNFISLTCSNILDHESIIAIGRILIHGFLVAGYIPIFINTSTLYSIMSQKQPSDNFLFDHFVECLDSGDRNLVSSAVIKETYDDSFRLRLAAFFGNHGVNYMPSPASSRDMFISLAKYLAVIKPFYFCHFMKSRCCKNVFGQISEAGFTSFVESLRPTGQVLAHALRASYSTNASAQALEERVFSYLQTFIEGLDINKAGVLLKFVSGAEVLSNDFIIMVVYNGISEEENMLPTANTCSATIHISKCSCLF